MKNIFILNFVILITFNINAQKAVPDFKVIDIYGHTHQLYKDYLDLNKYVFIDFFRPACMTCQEIAPVIDTVFRDFGCNYDELIFLGIDMDSYDSAVWKFTRDFNMTFPAISGEEGGGGIVFNSYGIYYTPYKILISPDKIIISDNPGFSNANELTDTLENIGFETKLCSGNDFIFYSIISETDSVVADIDHENHSIDIELPAGTNLTNLISTFINAINSTIEIDEEPQISGKTVLDFSGGPLVYQITSEDGYSENWTVNVSSILSIEYYNKHISIYPNPASDIFNVEITGLRNISGVITIRDITGQIIYKKTVDSNNFTVNLSNCNAGVYLIDINTEETNLTKKIILVK